MSSILRSPAGSSPPPMEEDNDQPAAEVRKDKGFTIPRFSPGAPRVDPRVAMRSSAAPRTPPKSYKEQGGNRKRKREPSLTPGGSKQPEARAKTSKQTPLRGGKGARGGSRVAGGGRGGGHQHPNPARHGEPSGSINNRGGKKSKGSNNPSKGGRTPKDTPSGSSRSENSSEQMVPLSQMQAWVSKAVADAFSQLDGRENTKKGSQDLNAGKAPEAEGSVPKENSPDAEGSQASKSSGSELLSRKEYAVLQREKFESFQAKVRNRTADEAVTADALKVAGPLARSDMPLTVKDILQFARYKTKDTTDPQVEWGEHPHSKWNKSDVALRHYYLVPGPKGEKGSKAIASSDLKDSPPEHVNYSEQFFASILVERETIIDLGNRAACGECSYQHNTFAEVDKAIPITVLLTDTDAAATYGRPMFTGLPVGGTRDWKFHKESKGLSTGEHSHRVKVANLFTKPLEVLAALFAQSHRGNELTVVIDLGRQASLLGHPPSAVIDELKKLASAVLAMRGPGMRERTRVLLLPPCFDLSGETDFTLNFVEPLPPAGSRIRLAEVNREILTLNAKAGHMKVNDLKSPLRFDQLHFKVTPESTTVGTKVFTTERMHRAQTEIFLDANDRVIPSPDTITKWYKRAIRYASMTPINDKRWSSVHFQ